MTRKQIDDFRDYWGFRFDWGWVLIAVAIVLEVMWLR